MAINVASYVNRGRYLDMLFNLIEFIISLFPSQILIMINSHTRQHASSSANPNKRRNMCD